MVAALLGSRVGVGGAEDGGGCNGDRCSTGGKVEAHTSVSIHLWKNQTMADLSQQPD